MGQFLSNLFEKIKQLLGFFIMFGEKDMCSEVIYGN